MHSVYFSLGSNIGNTKENLDLATRLLGEKVRIHKHSPYYETAPVGYQDQDWFLNIALKGETALAPEELLTFTQSIEQNMKRVKTIRFGPRNIDIDILLYDQLQLTTADLIIPHPRMLERAFVLVPLHDINPDLDINGMPIKQAIEKLGQPLSDVLRRRKFES